MAGTVLAPAAAATDRADEVPRGHLDALAQAGLFGLFGPAPADLGAFRAVSEVLAGACGVTYFVWVQHHGPVRALAASANVALADRHLDDLRTGRVLGGVAFSHLRRPDPPPVVAAPVAGGYRVDGEAPWVTSWGLAGLYLVGARHPGGVVWFLLDARRGQPGVVPSARLALSAMGASATVRLGFRGLFVADDDVVSVQTDDEWVRQDRLASAQPNPAALGVASRCVALLGEVAPSAAAGLGSELDECRERAYRLADEPGTDPAHLDAMVAARAWGLVLATRAAAALVAATGGRALTLDHPAQRLLREAAFYSIQGHNPALRDALLAQLERS